MKHQMKNVVSLAGTIARLEQRFAPDGKELCRLTLAVNRYRPNPEYNPDVEGSLKFLKYTDYPQVEIWGESGKSANQTLGIGDNIAVEGGLRTSMYTKEGQTHYATNVWASSFILLAKKQPEPVEEPEGEPVGEPG